MGVKWRLAGLFVCVGVGGCGWEGDTGSAPGSQARGAFALALGFRLGFACMRTHSRTLSSLLHLQVHGPHARTTANNRTRAGDCGLE